MDRRRNRPRDLLTVAVAGNRLSAMANTTTGTAPDDEHLAAPVTRREDCRPTLHAAHDTVNRLITAFRERARGHA
jgi:hypothetical protein